MKEGQVKSSRDLFWWSFCNLYKYQIITLHTWNSYTQLYFKLKKITSARAVLVFCIVTIRFSHVSIFFLFSVKFSVWLFEIKKRKSWGFPGDPVVKTPCLYCRWGQEKKTNRHVYLILFLLHLRFYISEFKFKK